MEKSKSEWRERQSFCYLAVSLFVLTLLTPTTWADEGAAKTEGGGVFSGISKGLSNFTSSLPGIFSELSPADVGHKPRIRPHFSATQGYNSNARLGPKQSDAAWQARVAPGIGISIPSGKLYTEADYTYAFSTTQGRHTSAVTNTHNLNALARYDLTPDTIFGIGNNIQLSDVPGEGAGNTFLLETATAQAQHRIGPKLTASLSDTLQYFNDKSRDRQNDFIDDGVSLSLPYDVTSDLALGPTFTWNVRNFTKIDAKDYWQILPGVSASYKLGPKTTVSGNFGWAFRRFSHGNHHESELVYGAAVSHKLGHKFIWSVSYAKTLVDTFNTGFVFRDAPVATTLDSLDRDFRVLKSHRLGTTATYNFNEKNTVGVFGDFQFIEASRKDNVIHGTDNDEKSMEVGANYTFRINRYISFDLLYSFGRRLSTNKPGRENYTFHKLSGGVNISI